VVHAGSVAPVLLGGLLGVVPVQVRVLGDNGAVIWESTFSSFGVVVRALGPDVVHPVAVGGVAPAADRRFPHVHIDSAGPTTKYSRTEPANMGTSRRASP